MTLAETMKTLESLGTEQNRKIYRRHGAGDNQFGVSFANLYKLQKQIKSDHALAEALWQTGNVDARSLALLIADPRAMTEKQLDAWAGGVTAGGHADLLARYVVSASPHARGRAEAWARSKEEFVGQAGWDVLGILAMKDPSLPDAYFEKYLVTIEKQIHKAKNRTRYAMNGALIGIGMRNAKLRKLALAAAARIGKVVVDHGETNCKTPDAAAYIRKSAARR
ncbi:MAG: DNA alkylation repair protein [Bryobacteraceae bacterium]